MKYPNNNCGGTGQAPIDLSYKMPAVSIAEDELQKLYTNQRDDIHVAWNGFCSVVAMDKKGQELQVVNSEIAKKRYGGTNLYNGNKI